MRLGSVVHRGPLERHLQWSAGLGPTSTRARARAVVTCCPAVVFYEPAAARPRRCCRTTRSRRSSRRARSAGSRRERRRRGQPRALQLLQRLCAAADDGRLQPRREGLGDAFAVQESRVRLEPADPGLREQMNATSASLPRGESEFHHAGLETAPSSWSRPPRVAASPPALECNVPRRRRCGRRRQRLRPVPGGWPGSRASMSMSASSKGRWMRSRMRPIARFGYTEDYAVIDRLFAMERPR